MEGMACLADFWIPLDYLGSSCTEYDGAMGSDSVM